MHLSGDAQVPTRANAPYVDFGAALLSAAEDAARDAGKSLLVLDTADGAPPARHRARLVRHLAAHDRADPAAVGLLAALWLVVEPTELVTTTA